MTVETQILLAIIVPLVGMVGIALTGKWPNVREGATLLTATLNAINVWTILPVVLEGGRPMVAVLETSTWAVEGHAKTCPRSACVHWRKTPKILYFD